MEINNYPNYLIYEDGRVWSKYNRNGVNGRFLKPNKISNGYLGYHLCNKNDNKHKTVHRLIAEHFIPNPNNLPVVDHINQVRDDNRIENLRWATQSENILNSDLLTSNTGFTYIHERKYSWTIRIFILGYIKFYSKKKYSLEEVVFIRDMILDS